MSVTSPETLTAAVIPESVLQVDASLRTEVEQFLFFEAELLDERRFAEWLSLCADDISYWMPLRRNRLSREVAKETSGRDDLSHYDDNKKSLSWRVGQILTGLHWAEDPPSRTRHLVTNVRVVPADAPREYTVRSNFICYRNRLDRDVDIFAGERTDTLRRLGPRQWQIARRTILLDQSVILSKNLSIFF